MLQDITEATHLTVTVTAAYTSRVLECLEEEMKWERRKIPVFTDNAQRYNRDDLKVYDYLFSSLNSRKGQ